MRRKGILEWLTSGHISKQSFPGKQAGFCFEFACAACCNFEREEKEKQEDEREEKERCQLMKKEHNIKEESISVFGATFATMILPETRRGL